MDSKVFDVSKPGKMAPSPISRPVIAASRPAFDPMVSKVSPPSESAPAPAPSISSTPIHVSMADEEPHKIISNSQMPGSGMQDAGLSKEESTMQGMPHASSPPSGATIPPHEMDQQPQQPPAPNNDNAPGNTFTPLTSLIPNADSNSKDDTGEYGAHHVDKLPQSHDGESRHHEVAPLQAAPGAGPIRRWPKVLLWLFILAFLAAAGAFLAIDGGYVKSDVKLPFHILNKQKTSGSTTTKTTVTKTSPQSSPPPAESAVPAGFTKFTVEGAGASFAYPTAWGAPSTTKDNGFTKRGGNNATDGTYAYLVNFATNKDIQVALTSSKYLPASDSKLYYQFLQWCVGTNDNKFYKQTLHATTENKVDIAGTVTCDQGPLTDATKLDDSTIVQLKTKDNAGAVLGDLYTKNLTSKDLTVLRIKDTQSKNSEDIKKLLSSVKTTDTAASSIQ
jgi:hypothetical protein